MDAGPFSFEHKIWASGAKVTFATADVALAQAALASIWKCSILRLNLP